MLVFGCLKPRKFQIMEIESNAKDDATGVLYTSPWVCRWLYAFCTPFRGMLYIHTRGYRFARLFPLVIRGLQTTNETKVQIPALFVFCSQSFQVV